MRLSKEIFNELVLELEQTPGVNEKEWRERVRITNDWEHVEAGDSWITTTKVIHYSFRNPNLNKILEEISGRDIRDCLTLHTVEAIPPQATVSHKDKNSELTLNILLEDDYEGGCLYLENDKVEGYIKKGDYLFYEGRKIFHSCTALTRGKRKALIVWFKTKGSLL